MWIVMLRPQHPNVLHLMPLTLGQRPQSGFEPIPPSAATRLRKVALGAWSALLLLAPGAAAPQSATITGRILDRESLKPIPQVAVTLRGTDRRAFTDSAGTFRLEAVPAGNQFLVVTHIAYGEHAESIAVRANDVLQLQVNLSQQAIQLTPLPVDGRTELELRKRASGSSFNEIARAEIEEGARRGLDLGRLLREGMPGVRVDPLGRMGGYCVEYRLSVARANEYCRAVAVFLDGVRVQGAGTLYTTLPLDQIERLELLAPAEAGARYGTAAGFGVLLIETRQGSRVARARTTERMLPGFDWSLEAQSYRWPRVLGASFVGNSVGLGLSALLVDQCLYMSGGDARLLRSRCDAIGTVGVSFLALVLPSAVGSLAARWAGSTDRSQGRIVASGLIGTLAVSSGALLLVHGESANSDAARTAGAVVVTVGVPLVLTLSDRAFRALR
jgi:hypothetical protein